jgi:hypothetical protein
MPPTVLTTSGAKTSAVQIAVMNVGGTTSAFCVRCALGAANQTVLVNVEMVAAARRDGTIWKIVAWMMYAVSMPGEEAWRTAWARRAEAVAAARADLGRSWVW